MGDSKRASIESGQAQPDDREPTPERQAELQAAYEANVAAGKAPYAGVVLRTRGELTGVMRERDWSGDSDAEGKARADLRGAHLGGATLRGAYLGGVDLSDANLGGVDLSDANLGSATLSGAHLFGADLSGANLRATHMNADTTLANAKLDARTRLADIVWNGVPVTRLNWQDVNRLGDEWVAHHQTKHIWGEPKNKATRLQDFQDAVLANRQVATVLRSQGLNEHADRFAYRAQLCQRIVSRRQRHYLRYVGSLLLDLLGGYGYRPGRAILLYLAIIVWFANFYVWASNGFITFGMPPSHISPLAWYEALILSVSSFHGRGFQPFQNLNDPVAALAGMQAVFGLVIEVSFIATFSQRFFGK